MSVRGFFVGVFNVTFHIFFRWDVKGFENIPETGAAVLCSNHISYCDPVSYVIHIKRMLYPMAKEELFRGKISNWFYRSMGCFPVKRGKGDVEAIETAIWHLKDGDLVAIYPEGVRNGLKKGIKPKKGAALVALTAKVPIVPMAIKASFRPFSKVHIRVGKPIDLSEYYGEGDEINPRNLITVTNLVMEKIQELLADIEEKH